MGAKHYSAHDKNTRKTLFVAFCLVLLLIAAMMLLKRFDGSGYYVEMVRPQVEDYEIRNRADDGPPSSQPSPQGFRESDIYKSEGHRFRTY